MTRFGRKYQPARDKRFEDMIALGSEDFFCYVHIIVLNCLLIPDDLKCFNSILVKLDTNDRFESKTTYMYERNEPCR